MSIELAILLGNIEGKLDMVISGQDEMKDKIGSIDNRLRKVETRSAVLGAGAGAVVSIGIALMIEQGKNTLGL
jgi:hypothetical protein